jgi:hypothetical protein
MNQVRLPHQRQHAAQPTRERPCLRHPRPEPEPQYEGGVIMLGRAMLAVIVVILGVAAWIWWRFG